MTTDQRTSEPWLPAAADYRTQKGHNIHFFGLPLRGCSRHWRREGVAITAYRRCISGYLESPMVTVKWCGINMTYMDVRTQLINPFNLLRGLD